MKQQVLLYLLKAMTSAPRLQILSELKRHSVASLEELSHAIRLSRKTTFYHLSRLVAREIVQRIRRGNTVRYQLAREQHQPVKQILALL